jgi:hypothetical protein
MKSETSALGILLSILFIAATNVMASSFAGNKQRSEDPSLGRGGEYKIVTSGRGETRDRILCSFSSYEASDGIKLFVRIEVLPSVDAMKIQFESKARSLARIIERRYLKVGQAGAKGERIVGKHSFEEPEIIRYVIMWSHGNEISYIESASLDHILEFEKGLHNPAK